MTFRCRNCPPHSRSNDLRSHVTVPLPFLILRLSCTTAALALCSLPLQAQEGGTIRWAAGAPLPSARDHHAVAIAGMESGVQLLVAGGTDYRSYFADVWSAPIDATGSVTQWRHAGTLPYPLAGTAAVVSGNTAVFIAGQRQDRSVTGDVHLARLAGASGLTDWRSGPALPTGRYHHAVAQNGRDVYVLGGQGPDGSLAEVHRARIDGDTLTQWTALTPLPRPRSHHAALVHQGYLYVVGGLDGRPADGPALLNDVRRAEILPDGSLGAWKLASVMPHSYSTHSAFAHDGGLYVLGGVEDNARFVGTVWRAGFGAEGRLGSWEQMHPALPPRAHVHVTPVHAGRVYSVGGSERRQVRGELDIGVLMPPGVALPPKR
jgi:N-acetylneuraminic acid mutarotase